MLDRQRPWWDPHAAWIVFWRVRETVYMNDGRQARFWQGWRTTFRAWWLVGHGTNLVS